MEIQKNGKVIFSQSRQARKELQEDNAVKEIKKEQEC
jgi:hypothetical protein